LFSVSTKSYKNSQFKAIQKLHCNFIAENLTNWKTH